MGDRIGGSCLCGGIRYEVETPLPLFGHCHCSRCRRTAGALYSCEVATARNRLRLTHGEELLGMCEQRCFCSRCGSSLFFGPVLDEARPHIGIGAGTLDGDPGARPMSHIYIDSKIPWVTIDDDLTKWWTEGEDFCTAEQIAAAAHAPPAPGPPSTERPVRGRCFCAGVEYELTGPFLRANTCHCTRCQKQSGSYGLTQGRIAPERFRLLRGGELLVNYAQDGHAAKVFCRTCGSSLFGGEWPGGRTVSIRLATLDGDAGIRPQFHTFVADKAAWEEIRDDLPQFPGRATKADMQRLGIPTG